MNNLELQSIITKFAQSGWDLIANPATTYLNEKNNQVEFIEAVKKADELCGSCGCDFDPLYKRFLELKDIL